MRNKTVILPAVLALCLMASVMVAAQVSPAANYSITWWTVDSGGGTSFGGTYSVSGSAGQAEAGSAVGGTYALTGGFWSGPSLGFMIYLPLANK